MFVCNRQRPPHNRDRPQCDESESVAPDSDPFESLRHERIRACVHELKLDRFSDLSCVRCGRNRRMSAPSRSPMLIPSRDKSWNPQHRKQGSLGCVTETLRTGKIQGNQICEAREHTAESLAVSQCKRVFYGGREPCGVRTRKADGQGKQTGGDQPYRRHREP